MIFSTPNSNADGSEHPIRFLKSLYSSDATVNLLKNDVSYINLEKKEFEFTTDDSHINPDLGLYPREALPLAIKHIESQWTPSEISHLFKDLTSVRFIRCGKTAVVFNLKNNQRYVVIFDNAQLIQNFFEGDAA